MSEHEEIQDTVDEVEDQYDSQQELTDAQLDQYDYAGTFPTAKEKSDIYSWFWKIVQLKDEPEDKELVLPFQLVKVGNLNNQDIGLPGISVRDSMNLAHLGDIFHHKKFGEYWGTRARINTATSMARKGWFMETTITQRKLRARERSTSSEPQKKWRMFGKKDQSTQEE